MLPYTHGPGPKPGNLLEPLRTAITHTEAHMLACLQSLHAFVDICTHVVYFGLGKRIHESIGERWPSPRAPAPECDD